MTLGTRLDNIELEGLHVWLHCGMNIRMTVLARHVFLHKMGILLKLRTNLLVAHST